jgi:ankyrin repeat protein
VACFPLVLDRCDADILHPRLSGTILHDVAALDETVTPGEALGFATALLDAGVRMDVRDDLLKSTPLGWACRWRRREIVRLLLERGADPVEADAEPWATPGAWADKMGHKGVRALLRDCVG